VYISLAISQLGSVCVIDLRKDIKINDMIAISKKLYDVESRNLW